MRALRFVPGRLPYLQGTGNGTGFSPGKTFPHARALAK